MVPIGLSENLFFGDGLVLADSAQVRCERCRQLGIIDHGEQFPHVMIVFTA